MGEKEKKYKRYIVYILFLLWIYIIIRLTISGRESIDEYRIKLSLFWTVKDAWIKKSSQDWFYLVANIYMFIPFGIFLPILFKKMKNWFNIFVAGLTFSFAIEIIQFFFKLGYFEFDDLINNTLGTVLGYAIFVVAVTIMKKYKPSMVEVYCATGLIVVVNMFFLIATMLGQPVFDKVGYYTRYYLERFL